MNILQNRIRSFRTRSKWTRSSKNTPSIEKFAAAGFYCPRYPKTADSVQCFQCDVILDEWNHSETPITRHIQASPLCPWVLLGFPTTNTNSHGLPVKPHDLPSHSPKSDIMRKARLKTFTKDTHWPPLLEECVNNNTQRRLLPTVSKLADAGFCYIPSNEKDDKVICVYCCTTLSGIDKSTQLV
ncbi:hypothetical protein BDF14DRAFT_286616 [Spinellus fusiger]|nr:hypothetical protein BDF14DRAFT_286616 [Spinellus fusiger]